MPGGAAAGRGGRGGRTCDLPTVRTFLPAALASPGASSRETCRYPASLPGLLARRRRRVRHARPGVGQRRLRDPRPRHGQLPHPWHPQHRDWRGARRPRCLHPVAGRERAPGPGHPRRPHQLRTRPEVPRPRRAEQADRLPVHLPAAVARADGRRCTHQAAQRRDRSVRHHRPRQQRHLQPCDTATTWRFEPVPPGGEPCPSDESATERG